ncbi:hypothetical protein B0J11DRAFT_571019 [Dendryphion nanum]|uniref:Uncharacterized protein n=1 Tax=Dendryphion nanum TaxID=256645 RepID=A0A9P9DEN0_9PLEO|nr:hypothetical protein B0J11DRAFT_571019 [Dendryphion nanum]
MRLTLLLSLLFTTALAIPNTLFPRLPAEDDTTTPQPRNTCFDNNRGKCVGHYAKRNLAYAAIVKACRQIDCNEQGPSTENPVHGRVSGFTATLKLGPQCGGVTEWDTEGCAGLFMQFVDRRCQSQYKSSEFNLGYATAKCDGTFVSLNY